MATVAETMAQGWQQFQSGRYREAEHFFQQVVRLEPRNADALYLLGVIAFVEGKHELALKQVSQAIEYRPDMAPFYYHRGMAQAALGRPGEAVASYQHALRLQPAFPEALNNLGVEMQRQHRVQEAIDCFTQAVRCNPDFAEAKNNLGAAYQVEGKLQDAVLCYRQALRCNPHYTEAKNNLAMALSLEGGNLDEAEAVFQEAVRLNPNSSEAHHNLGFVLKMQGKLAPAAACFERALALDPANAEAYNNLGNALKELGKLDEALASYERALRLRPDHANYRLNRAFLWLAQGNFDKGWTEYEFRWEDRYLAPYKSPAPLWDGSSLRGKTILLRTEQGFGDAIQFVRYAALVKEQGGTVLLVCPEPLVRLLRTCPGIDRIVPSGQLAPPFDVQAPLMSLPRMLRTTLETVPNQVPYLHADPALAEQWRSKLGGDSSFKIGISWQGNPRQWDAQLREADVRRSIPLELFEHLAQVPGVSLYSLQKGFGADQLARLAGRFPVTDLGSQLNDFMDTAAVIQNLDLVVSVDSSPVHLAGALGKPAWAALPFSSCWRWLTQRADSPWYPTMRLFRQKEQGDWRDVFQRMAEALREEVPKARPPAATPPTAVSLVDRMNLMAKAAQTMAQGWEQFQAGQHGEAEQLCHSVLRLDPKHADALYLLGVIAHEEGKHELALQHLRVAIEHRPDRAVFHYHQGLANAALGRLDEAIVSYKHALRLEPGFAEGVAGLGLLTERQNRVQDAVGGPAPAAPANAGQADAHYRQGVAFHQQNFLDAAVSCYRQALGCRPDFAEVHSNLGAALNQMGRLDEAVPCLREAIRCHPGFAAAHNNLGSTLQQLGQADEAMACFESAIRLKPDYAEARLARAFLLLRAGQFEAGWPALESRCQCGDFSPLLRTGPQPTWEGADLRGRTILLRTEQGMGDALQFVRYAAMVQRRGGKVIVESYASLLPLLRTCPGVQGVVALGDIPPLIDECALLVSLPRIFGTTMAAIPRQIPYLHADPNLVERWKPALAHLNMPGRAGFKIGIVWQGNPQHAADRFRSVPLARFAPLARVPGVQLVSLQVGPGHEQIAALGDRFRILDLGNRFDPSSFADAAAMVKNLDLVVTVDTAMAHLAGALAVPVWVPLALAPDWRWLLEREDSPWYPTMRLFRQKQHGEWDDVFERIAAAVGQRIMQAQTR